MLADIRAELSVDGKEPTDLEVYEETGKRLLAVENRLRVMMDLDPISMPPSWPENCRACWRLQRRQKKTAAQIPRFRDRKSRIRHQKQMTMELTVMTQPFRMTAQIRQTQLTLQIP